MTRVASVLTHRRAVDTADALAALIAAAARAGVTLRFDAEETRKHGLQRRGRGSRSTRRSRTTSTCAS